MGKHVDDTDRKKCQHIPNMGTWFAGKDVAGILGYVKARNAIAKHVSKEDKKDAQIQGRLGEKQKMTIINESSMLMKQTKEFSKVVKHHV